MFAFGQFSNLRSGTANYNVYEVPVFFAMGVLGGILGAAFNEINRKMTLYRNKFIKHSLSLKLLELLVISGCMATIGFVLSISWGLCTPIPAVTADTSVQEEELLKLLVPFRCSTGYYNQLASLYITSGDIATRQLVNVMYIMLCMSICIVIVLV